MAGTVIIVHPSEILRKGFLSVLGNEISAEILCFADSNELIKVQKAYYSELILILPDSLNSPEMLVSFRAQTQRILVAGISFDNTLNQNHELFDTVFSINTTANELLKQVKQFFSFNNAANQDDELTIREKEVLRLIALGHTNKSIADTLFISTHTVISHRKNITDKLGIKSIPGLTVYAIIQNIISQSDISKDKLI